MRRAAGHCSGCSSPLLAAPGGGRGGLEPVGTSTSPIFVTSEPADPDRLLVVEQAGASCSSSTASRATFLDLTEPTRSAGQRAANRAALGRARPRLREHRAPLRLLHPPDGDGRRPADRRVHRERRPRRRIASRRPVLTIDHEQSATTTAASCSSGPTATSTSPPATAGAGGDPPRTPSRLTPCSARSCASTRAAAGGSVHGPGRQPVRRPNGRRRDLELRAAQPVAVLLRPRDR